MPAGVQEASMVSVPQFFPSGQSAGFTKSSIEICVPASAPGSLELSSSWSLDIASINMVLPQRSTGLGSVPSSGAGEG